MSTPTSGPNSAKPTTGAVIGGVYNAAGETLVDGQASPIQLDVNGNVKVAATVTPSGTQNVNIADVSGNPPALSNPLPVELSDGTNALGVTGNPVHTTDAANGATGSSAPTTAEETGFIAATVLPTAVSSGQLVGAMGDKFGRSVTFLNGMRDIIGTASVQNTGASGTLIGQIASTFTDIIQLILTNESATATVVSVSDGTTTYKFALAANGGGVFTFPTPLPATTSNTNWTVSNSASSTIDCVVVYVKNK